MSRRSVAERLGNVLVNHTDIAAMAVVGSSRVKFSHGESEIVEEFSITLSEAEFVQRVEAIATLLRRLEQTRMDHDALVAKTMRKVYGTEGDGL